MRSCLTRAIGAGRTVLTVPWVVEYLSMMDSTAPKLAHYDAVLRLLLLLYRSVALHFGREPCHAQLLLVTYLGWLFEVRTVLSSVAR